MKKIFILLPILIFIIAVPASAANLFCPNCSDPNLPSECVTPCQNQPGQASVCQCEGAMVTYPATSQTDCDTKCAPLQTPVKEADKIYKLCPCTSGLIFPDQDLCKVPCSDKNFVNKLACVCKKSTVPPVIPPSGTTADKACQSYCETAQEQTSPPTAPETEKEPPEFITQKAPKLFVQIPGINLTDIQVTTTGSGQINVPWISQYIIGIYKYSMGFAAILAVIVVMIAGFMYLTSAGNQQRIGQAKNFIIGAISGLVILASSYLILNLVSPQLTELGTIEIEAISEEQLETEFLEVEFEGRTNEAAAGHAFQQVKLEHKGKECGNPSIESGIGDPSLMKKYPDLACLSVGRRSLNKISRVTLHEGSSANRNATFWLNKYTERGKITSSHYTIERSGKIYQLLGEEKVGIHAPGQNSSAIGIDLTTNVLAKYRYRKIDDCLQLIKDGKLKSKGTTKEAAIKYCTPKFTGAQMTSLKRLLENIASRTGYTFAVGNTWSHCEGGGHSDPRNFRWEDIGQSTEVHQQRSNVKTKLCHYFPLFEERVKELADQIFGQ